MIFNELCSFKTFDYYLFYQWSKNQYVYDHPANNIKGDDKMGKQASDKYHGETGLENMNEICCKTKETSDGNL